MTIIKISFRHCFRGLLSDKIILLTTSNTRYYQEADRIIHLKDGKIRELKAGVQLAELCGPENDTTTEEKKSADDEMPYDPDNLDIGVPLKQEREKREVGRVAFKVYKEYFSYGASAIVWFFLVLVLFSGQGKKMALLLTTVYAA